jgi:hypothetical protein
MGHSIFGPKGPFGLIDRKQSQRRNALAAEYDSRDPEQIGCDRDRRYRLPTEGAERLSREHRRVRQAVRLRHRLNRQLPVNRIDPTEQSWLFIARAFQSAIGQ